jgi:hypothetical protein
MENKMKLTILALLTMLSAVAVAQENSSTSGSNSTVSQNCDGSQNTSEEIKVVSPAPTTGGSGGGTTGVVQEGKQEGNN